MDVSDKASYYIENKKNKGSHTKKYLKKWSMITLTHKAFTCITLILPNELKKWLHLTNDSINGDHQKGASTL